MLCLACGSSPELTLLTGPKPAEFQPLEVEAWARCGKTLKVRVHHEGGCKPHRYALHWDGSELQSMPPQIPLTALHDADGDTCKEPVTETLAYDTSKAPGNWSGDDATVLLVDADGRYLYDTKVECDALQ